MAKIRFLRKNFRQPSLDMIDTINSIVDNYIKKGYRLTVRQLYYQLVSKDIIENNLKSYKRTSGLINDGKNAGLIDWYAIEDRGREFITRSHWESPKEILEASASSYFESMWENQRDYQVYVIVEKEALVGILQKPCYKFDVPLLAAKGYPSGTVLFEFFENHIQGVNDKRHIIIHLGDHDPSGLDMTRDLTDRINMFSRFNYNIKIERIALNYDQIEELKPPPNYAKDTDSRFVGYAERYGDSSWELDALTPEYIDSLVTKKIESYIDFRDWEVSKDRINSKKEWLRELADSYDDNAGT